MNRLRHPARAIREPFGTAGLVVACVALVFALTGAAFAAKGALTGKQKKEVEKIAKKFAGKPGTPGANGTDGSNGSPGHAGEPGAAGKDGTSATTAAIPTSSATCSHNGGVEVKSASPTQNVCNGTTGFTKTLPSGETETGSWASSVLSGDAIEANIGKQFFAPITLPIRLAAGLEENEGCTEGAGRTEPCHVHYINTEGEEVIPSSGGEGSSGETVPGQTDCLGSANEPLATKGNLCVYEGNSLINGDGYFEFLRIVAPEGTIGESGISPVGGSLYMTYAIEAGGEVPGRAFIRGSWAVTAP